MKRFLTVAAAAVAAQTKAAAADPMSVVAANPLRALVQQHTASDANIACLRGYLRGERATQAMIELVLDKLQIYPFQAELAQARDSHRVRGDMLAAALARRGDTDPTGGEDDWRLKGERLACKLALMASERTALRFIQGREAFALRVYRGEHPQLDEEARRLVAFDLLQEQEKTDALFGAMAKRL